MIVKQHVYAVDCLGETQVGDPGLGRRLRNKLARYGRILSQELAGQIRLLYQAFRNPDTPLQAKLMIAAALAYFILPTDSLPDFLPGLGFTDDAAIVALALRKLREILAAHQARLKERHLVPLPSSDTIALRLDLALAERKIAALQREAVKWRRVAKTMAALLALLSFLLIWITLTNY